MMMPDVAYFQRAISLLSDLPFHLQSDLSAKCIAKAIERNAIIQAVTERDICW